MIDANLDFPVHGRCVTGGDGYLRFYMPEHPLASRNGMVLAARHVASLKLGRWLTPGEVAYHEDGNRSNIAAENITIKSLRELASVTLPSHQVQRVKLICARVGCGNEFDVSPSHVERRRTCSPDCRIAMSRRFEIRPDEMALLVWQYPTTKIGEMFGVSDKAIEKFCKKHGIQKPPRGYWAKMYAGQRDPSVGD